jgi:parallel beta-helix repeat protein
MYTAQGSPLSAPSGKHPVALRSIEQISPHFTIPSWRAHCGSTRLIRQRRTYEMDGVCDRPKCLRCVRRFFRAPDPDESGLHRSECHDLRSMMNGAAKGPADARAVLRVPDDYATIQAAVDAAQSGDTINVAPGAYCEHVVITKSNLRLHSAGGRAVVNGDCVGKRGAGIHVMGASGVEIMGFTVEHFEYGFQLMSISGSQIHSNTVRANLTVPRTGVIAGSRGIGILLQNSTDTVVSENDLEENGRDGITLNGGSGNTIQANRLVDNNLEQGGCNLMVTGTASGNSVVENTITGTFGAGIMIGPAAATGNAFAQNRIHGFGGPGIIAMAAASGNFIEQNDARGNGLTYASPQNVDLFDATQPVPDNTWLRNLGTCGPGVC